MALSPEVESSLSKQASVVINLQPQLITESFSIKKNTSRFASQSKQNRGAQRRKRDREKMVEKGIRETREEKGNGKCCCVLLTLVGITAVFTGVAFLYREEILQQISKFRK